ncbi:enoyl-CoA hydratase/isomerase family protein [Bradyrhizobium jicamae]|uniref:enoyl-CoA hydratase-related protein n=1 Tax=Bradyrhizobium jicamae TaxID=280332 RepID=UPI001BAE13E1|nr:enoyl-CoA hydratase-related protein [Bradyrhizobium jicamae]MBR0756266.1 enoyl-CoA hydratase/isomerase family protein [Bradyrhizobium jicamae]
MKDFADIVYAVSGAVARISVNRPDRLNAYRNETADELRAALGQAEADTSIKVVIVTGEGRAFGAGYDLSTVKPNETPQLDRVLERHFNPLVLAMRHARVPIITVINGPCAGAAVGIALAGDIVLAARNAYFYEPFVGIALVPDAGNTLFLSRMLGRVRASGMMLLGDRISAEQACDWGLVWRVVDPEELNAEADRIAAKLVSLAPAAVAATKQLIGAASEHGLAGQLALERDLQGEAGRSPEMRAAIHTFFAAREKTSHA